MHITHSLLNAPNYNRYISYPNDTYEIDTRVLKRRIPLSVPGPQAPVREPSDFLFTCIILTVIVLMYAFRTRLTSPQSSGHTVKNYNEPVSAYLSPFY
ncbi:hypothetical protein X777_02731 [Ooceraea biroi]|uniref:Uncharacterized protein n=1 Tax=Ooceraea biroi TaxID=2015173 RepID=A0A026WLG0_OOCBI|nr:hypothetical protein X777_02731 [Ooceraea biroi]